MPKYNKIYPHEAIVPDKMQFYNFMAIVAAHTSKPVAYGELASVICMAADLLPVGII